VRSGPCLPVGAKCSQLFAYEWDEVGRLVEAQRWDVDATAAATLTASSDPPSGPAAAHLRHRYDANDTRVIKTAVDATAAERSTIYVFGSLELRRADTVAGDYDRATLTEVPYLMAHGVRLARVVCKRPVDRTLA
jgi:predicted methyltransferase